MDWRERRRLGATGGRETRASFPGASDRSRCRVATSGYWRPVERKETVVEKLLLTAEEAAQALGIGRTRVYELMAGGVLTSVKIGASRRVPVDALREYVARLTGEAA